MSVLVRTLGPQSRFSLISRAMCEIYLFVSTPQPTAASS
jgi:hypothetical protein